MSEAQRTGLFVGVAALSVVIAVMAAPSTPKPPAEFADVGTPFFPEFEDPLAATALEVVGYSEDTAEARIFRVEFKDGVWKIPSRFNYPADGKDRLGKTATSMLGIKKESLAGRLEAEHEEFGVIDPMSESTALKGRGQRIKLQGPDNKTFADIIVGKQVPGRSGFYYVRRADEKPTYIAKLDLSLSTKFADWIETDLLKLDGNRLTGINIDKYSVDLDQGRIVGRDPSELTRKSSSDPWKLDGIDEATEEVNADEVRKLVNALDDLKIMGVRTKPVKLSRDLALDEGIQLNAAIAADMQSKGYFFAKSPEGGQQLVSKEGEVIARTDQGVVYDLRFGDVFNGTEEEIELGFTKSEGSDDKKDDGEKKADEKPAVETTKSRYLFVTAHFDENLIGDKPAEPVKPTEPSDEAAESEEPADALAATNTPAGDPKTQYEAALKKYEADKAAYEGELASWNAKKEEGEKKVKELNARFAEWYYVISAENFDNLSQGRASLVKSKKAAAESDAPVLPPGLPPGLQN
ncbi:MAG: DUF4340 domain-containing protein [Planctomycetaceae bacterium]|nr:DUF4340 domain-containing protein [Planctomycetaceae bacterium]